MQDDYLLYGADGSGSAAIELALPRTGVRWRRIDAPPWVAKTDLSALAAANPLKQLPTLVLPDGSVLTESAAILIHLGLVSPEAGLLATEASARAREIRGLVFIAANCYSAIGLIDHPQRWCGPLERADRAQVRVGARGRLHAQWDHFADVFVPTTNGPWLSGARPGALDFLALVVAGWSGTRAHLRRRRPALAGLFERLEREPDVAAVMKLHPGD